MGVEPTRVWLQGLSREARRTIGADLFTIQTMWPVGGPLVANLGDGLWELRSTYDRVEYRVLFAVASSAILILHGFVKKTQKTPHEAIQLANDRLTAVRAFLRQK
jgi:phage-related protein